MKDITLVKLALIFGSLQFWMTSFVLYLGTKGFNNEQIYLALGLHSTFIILLEYPTGVIGDYFSHKLSVLLGTFIATIIFPLFIFSEGYPALIIFLLLGALGTSLISGSDTALIHNHSKNFKKDLSQVKMFSLIMSASAIAIGGLLSKYNLNYPLYATWFFFLISALFVLFVKDTKNHRESGNIFAASIDGIKYAISDKLIINAVILSSLVGAFFLAFKWFYNPLFIEMKIPVEYWGIIIGTAYLLIASGVWFYQKFSEKKVSWIFLGTVLSIFLIGFTNFISIPIIAIFLAYNLKGYLEAQMDVKINHAIGKSFRASIFSFKSLIIRLMSSIFIFSFGFILERSSFFTAMTIFAVLIFIIGIIPLLKIQKIPAEFQRG